MTSERDRYWSDYYARVTEKGDSWLDYSNERVQAQTFGLCLEAAGPVAGRRCLDAGCGWGQFCRCLHALGAAEVVGVDIMEKMLDANRRTQPEIEWRLGSVQDDSFVRSLGEYDLIFMLEILQVVSARETVASLWRQVRPGGRLVAMMPNKECPIITRTIERFNGLYTSLSPGELGDLLQALPQADYWAYRGLHFLDDQRLAPYGVSAWSTRPIWEAPPNRLQFVVERKRD